MSESASDISKHVALGNASQVGARKIGAEKAKVVVVDNVFDEINFLHDYTSRSAVFQTRKANAYPGAQARMIKDFGEVFLDYALALIANNYPETTSLQCKPLAAFFSYVSTPEKELEYRQTIPHYDHTSSNSFAVMLYMAPGDFSGTGFFKHDGTSFETISANREKEFWQYLEKHDNSDLSNPKYCVGNNAGFSMIDSVDYQQNRMLIYPGNLLHSGLIDESRDIHAETIDSRLTANLFLTYE